MAKKTPEGICEMCGHYVQLRQKAHIIAEGPKSGNNLLMLCPSCHMMFDTHLKPKMFNALSKAGCKGLPELWEISIYEQAKIKSSEALKNKK